MNYDLNNPRRIEEIARQAGMERSLYLGEAIGNALAIAWQAMGSLGSVLRRDAPPFDGSAKPAHPNPNG